MSQKNNDLFQQVLAHFENHPYPRRPEKAKVITSKQIYSTSAHSAFYRRDRHLPKSDLKILDVGCGTGRTTLALKRANPSATIIGIDNSRNSIELARQRGKARNIDVEFKLMNIEDLSSLGEQFDYINCDEVLYFFDDPVDILEKLKSVLHDGGIIRANLHNIEVRKRYMQMGNALRMLGYEDIETEDAIENVRQFYGSLSRKGMIRSTRKDGANISEEQLYANEFLTGDHAFSFDEVLTTISQSGLNLIDMVDHYLWNVETLFDLTSETGQMLAAQCSSMNRVEQLKIYELLCYKRRLFDFWCCPQQIASNSINVMNLPFDAWPNNIKVQLNPALKKTSFVKDAKQALKENVEFDPKQFFENYYSQEPFIKRKLRFLVLLCKRSWEIDELLSVWETRMDGSMSDGTIISKVDLQTEVRYYLRELEKMGVAYILHP